MPAHCAFPAPPTVHYLDVTLLQVACGKLPDRGMKERSRMGFGCLGCTVAMPCKMRPALVTPATL